MGQLRNPFSCFFQTQTLINNVSNVLGRRDRIWHLFPASEIQWLCSRVWSLLQNGLKVKVLKLYLLFTCTANIITCLMSLKANTIAYKPVLILYFRLPRVTVRHEYIGLRSYQVSPITSVQDVKQLLYEESDLPVKEQRLTHNGRVVRVLLCNSRAGIKWKNENKWGPVI